VIANAEEIAARYRAASRGRMIRRFQDLSEDGAGSGGILFAGWDGCSEREAGAAAMAKAVTLAGRGIEAALGVGAS